MNTTSLRNERTLCLLDLENLAGGSAASANVIRQVWEVFSRHAIALAPDSQTVVATGPTAAREAWFALPQHGIQRLVRAGRDGADTALTDYVDLDHLARRFDRLVIGSGDGHFTQLARAACYRGLAVTLVLGKGRPAHSLLEACPRRVWLKLDKTMGLSEYRARQLRRTACTSLALAA